MEYGTTWKWEGWLWYMCIVKVLSQSSAPHWLWFPHAFYDDDDGDRSGYTNVQDNMFLVHTNPTRQCTLVTCAFLSFHCHIWVRTVKKYDFRAGLQIMHRGRKNMSSVSIKIKGQISCQMEMPGVYKNHQRILRFKLIYGIRLYKNVSLGKFLKWALHRVGAYRVYKSCWKKVLRDSPLLMLLWGKSARHAFLIRVPNMHMLGRDKMHACSFIVLYAGLIFFYGMNDSAWRVDFCLCWFAKQDALDDYRELWCITCCSYVASSSCIWEY